MSLQLHHKCAGANHGGMSPEAFFTHNPHSASAAMVAHDGFQYDLNDHAALSVKGGTSDGWRGAWACTDALDLSG